MNEIILGSELNNPKLIEEMATILERANTAYEEKRYLDSRNLIKQNKNQFIAVDGKLLMQALRRWQYAAYYLGNEGNPRWKDWIIDNPIFYEEAVKIGEEAIEKFIQLANIEVRVSVLNALALATRWIKKNGEFRRQEAYLWNDQAVLEARTSSRLDLVSVALNTRNILLREDKKIDEAVKGCQEVFENSVITSDFITAGHGKQNEGDTYRLEIKETQDKQKIAELHIEACKAYKTAQAMYALYEKVSGKKATAHYESAGRKATEEENEAVKAKLLYIKVTK
jgi:hypothetical protein